MTVNAYRIAAIDLDGTLLRRDGSVSAHTRQSIRRAAARGIAPVLVSARPPRIVRDHCEALEIEGLALCCNGAIAYDPLSDAVIDSVAIAPDAVKVLMRDLRAAIPGIMFAWECGLAYGCEQGFLLEHHFTGGCAELGSVASEVNKVLAHHPRLHQAELRIRAEPVVGGLGTVTISGPDVVEITAPDADKAAGVARVARSLGVEPAAVVAFCDMPNDVALLEWAGLGVAVANAHHEVLAVAGETTASNDDDGVALVLDRLTRTGHP